MAIHGLGRAIEDTIEGMIFSGLVAALLNSGLIPPQYKLLFDLINMITIVSLIKALPYWGTYYLLGWLIGMGLMYRSGALELWDSIPAIVGVLVLISRNI